MMEHVGAPSPCLTVTQLNLKAKQLLERQFPRVMVSGEVSGVRETGGHLWFSLKDAGGVLAAVIFRRDAMALRFALKDGLQAIATGRLTVYPANGRYQMVVSRLEPCGAGALQAAFEALKIKLQGEGLFDARHKRPLPRLPRRVAVITSPTGAVIRDIVHVGTRRFVNLDLLLVPARVQGPDCAAQVAAAIARVAAQHRQLGVDVLMVARGGGSLEDLWGFNDEQVARAIATCPIPVVSAVGHETDFTIADFVADVRAPTPSAAAELVFPAKSELTQGLQQLVNRLTLALRRQLGATRLRLRAARAELGDGRSALLARAQRLAIATGRIEQAMRAAHAHRRQRLAGLEVRLTHTHPRVRLQGLRGRQQAAWLRLRATAALRLSRHRHALARCSEARLRAATTPTLAGARHRLAHAVGRLHALSPLGVLSRGYSITFDAAGVAVRRAGDVRAGERLTVRLAEGHIDTRVI